MKALANNIRLLIFIVTAFMVVAVDFTSKLLSITADGLLVCVLIAVAWPVFKIK